MTKKERKRAELIIAMDKLARCLNDEDIFFRWLMGGVADGDVTSDTKPEDIDESYLEDDTFSYIMGEFVNIIYQAKKENKKSNRGTLFATGIISKGEDKDI